MKPPTHAFDDALVFAETGHLNDTGLAAAVDGELREGRASSHLESCELCGRRFGEAALAALQMTTALRAITLSASASVAREKAPIWSIVVAFAIATMGSATQLGKTLAWASHTIATLKAAAPQLASGAHVAVQTRGLAWMATAVLVAAGLAIALVATKQSEVEGVV